MTVSPTKFVSKHIDTSNIDGCSILEVVNYLAEFAANEGVPPSEIKFDIGSDYDGGIDMYLQYEIEKTPEEIQADNIKQALAKIQSKTYIQNNIKALQEKLAKLEAEGV